MDIIDIGVNLEHDSFDSDREQVMERAADAGVRRMIVTGSSHASSVRASKLASEHPGRLYSTAGIHPHHAVDYTHDDREWIVNLVENEWVVAIGECGLDFFRNFSDPKDQEAAFIAQLVIARETGLPVFLHQRDAHERFSAILRDHIGSLQGGVAHCFTGGQAELEAYLDLGLYIGITGWVCDERRGVELASALKYIPHDRLLIETDAPYLLPRDLVPRPKKRRNEPMYLAHVLSVIARHVDCESDALAAQTTANATRLFGLLETGTGDISD
ncbi:MAG: TatD family hydrolase [Gammaproteobacteria bacterium]